MEIAKFFTSKIECFVSHAEIIMPSFKEQMQILSSVLQFIISISCTNKNSLASNFKLQRQVTDKSCKHYQELFFVD